MRVNISFARAQAAALLLTGLLATPAVARTREAAISDNAVDLSHVRIDNFGRVDATYYRGGQPEGDDYAQLAALGIKTVINLTSDDAEANESAMAERAGMAYFQIPITTHVVPTSAQIEEFLRIVNDPASQPVYVHCVGGRHRTGVMTAVYRMTDAGWSADQAFKEMKQYRFGSEFLHPEFKRFVYAYPAESTRVASTANPPVATVRAGK